MKRVLGYNTKDISITKLRYLIEVQEYDVNKRVKFIVI